MAPRGLLEALKSGLRGLSGRVASKQEVNASSFPTAAGPALPLVPGAMNGAAPALFSAC